MSASLSSLTTRAECDAALVLLAAKLAIFQHRDDNITFADDQATARASSTAARLAKAIDDVARYTADVARPGITAVEKLRAQNGLISATAQRDHLALATSAQTGADAYMVDVAADQVDSQIAVLTASQAAVTAHRATRTS